MITAFLGFCGLKPGKEPIIGEIETTDGHPYDERGALAVLRIAPPSYPWTVTRVSYVAARLGGVCAPTWLIGEASV